MSIQVDIVQRTIEVQMIEDQVVQVAFWDGSGVNGVQEIVAGTNVTVDNTDPTRPVVSATGGGGGGGAVDSVNGETGVVVLDAADVGADAAGSAAAALSSANAYTDAKVQDSITDGETTKAPSQNAVFDALANKVDKSITVNGAPLSSNVIAPSSIFFAPSGSTRSISAFTSNVALANTAIAANQLRAYPLIITKVLSFDQIITAVGTGVASTEYRVGIYENSIVSGLNYPGALISGTDVQVYSSVTSSTNNAGTINITLQPGLYWLAYNSNGAATFRCFNGLTVLPMVNGFVSTLPAASAGHEAVGWQITDTYNTAGLPNPFPSSATIQNPSATNYMLIRLRPT